MTRRSRLLLTVVLPALLLAGSVTFGGPSAGAVPAPADPVPAAEVRLGQEGTVGRFSSVRVPVLYRCQLPWLVAGLNVHVAQGDVTGYAFREDGLVCDATWNRLVVDVPSDTGWPFVVGYADIDVSIDVQDPVSFDPVEQARASARIWIAPPTRIVVKRAVLKPNGSVMVTASARCMAPWILAGYGLSVSQREGFVYAASFRDTGLVCNGVWHRVRLRVAGSQRFVRGPAVIGASIHVLDPDNFDPVGSDTDSRTLRLRR